MTTSGFDALAKTLATRHSRRAAIGATGGGLLAGIAAGTHRAAAQEATPQVSTSDPEFLFVQTAASGSFTPNPDAGTPTVAGTPTPGGGGDYLLTLEGHAGGTVYFSDRPERIFGEAPTQAFLDGLGFSPANPPNAALVTDTADGEPDVVILELLDPTYDVASGTVTYGVTLLSEYAGAGLAHVADQAQDTALPESFDHASLFIDDCPDITDCTYVYIADPISAGPVPGGPYGQCWNWDDFDCIPCSEPQQSLDALCARTYPVCGDACTATS